MTTSKGGIHLVGAAALLAQAEQRGRAQAAQPTGMTRDSIRVETCKIMVKQFREQCSAVEQGDPARTVVELMLDSFEKVLTQ